ncbi:MAG: hypothetical protein JWP90_654 [Mycetocola sp.]|nr:hypothetical protein [Mycetocola sp.]
MTGTETAETSTHPPPRWRALRTVIARQRRRQRARPVTGGDRPQEVLIAVADAHHPHRHRHPAHLRHHGEGAPPRSARGVGHRGLRQASKLWLPSRAGFGRHAEPNRDVRVQLRRAQRFFIAPGLVSWRKPWVFRRLSYETAGRCGVCWAASGNLTRPPTESGVQLPVPYASRDDEG